jgi:hypothetical protein
METTKSRLLLSAVVGALTACGGDAPQGSTDIIPIPGPVESTSDPIGRPASTGGNFLNQISDVVNRIQRNLNPDQIPALTDPVFVSATDGNADYVSDDDLVLGLFINGDAKAYPHNIGWLHEITNDVVGGKAVVVSFCPLTGTGMVFDGDGSGGRLTCGVSGNLFNNNLVMYDRRDPLSSATLYPQMMGMGVFGARAGQPLNLLPVVETTWGYWKTLHPNTTVVGSNQPVNVGNPRRYGQTTYQLYPYDNYRDPQTSPFFSTWPSQNDNPTRMLYSNKSMTLGVRFGELAKAYPFETMDSQEVINDTIGNQGLVVVYSADEKLALPFSRHLNGQMLTFERVPTLDAAVFPFMMRDTQTGTTWDLLGRGVDGPNAGQQLEQLPAHNAFWFAWATFWQNTGVL